MILLNIDDRCTGTYTWSRGGSKSVIDLVIVNDFAFGRFEKMVVDEEREKIDISDHCIVEIEFKVREQKNENLQVVREYYSFTEDRKGKFRRQVEETVGALVEPGVASINTCITEAAQQHLKRTYKGKQDRETTREKPWMNEEIKQAIKERKNVNRLHRNAREGAEKQVLWEQYLAQRRKVKEMIRLELRIHEDKLSERILKKGNSREM